VSATVAILGSRPVSGVVRFATRSRVRALTYHGVDDPTAFAMQLDWIASCGYRTVTGQRIAAWLAGGTPLPKRALWITFDDGDSGVIEHALPLLTERGMVATAFLCGAWIGTDEAPWWEVVAAAVDADDLVRTRVALKRSADAQRRERVAQMAEQLRLSGTPAVGKQWSEADVAAWRAAGNDIGNHSWDHPCLDRCTPEEQRQQVRRAHDTLSELNGVALDVFAWPNGDPSPDALDELRTLGYELIAECDHRLVARKPDRFALSRLKLDSNADLPRTRAIVSGAHSAVFHLQQRIRGKGESHAVT